MFCSERSLVKHAPAGIEVSCLWCNSWGCDICGERRAWKVSADMQAGKPFMFLTLTVNPAFGISKEQRARSLLNAWRAWVAKVRREHGKQSIEYAYVFEAQKSGEPHLHIVGRWPWIGKEQYSAYFGKKIGAPSTRIEFIQSQQQLCSYLSKYLTKDLSRFGTLKRYGLSKGYRLRPRPQADTPKCWRGPTFQVDRPCHEIFLEKLAQGWQATDESRAGWWRLYKPPPKPPPLWRLQSGLMTDLRSGLAP